MYPLIIGKIAFHYRNKTLSATTRRFILIRLRDALRKISITIPYLSPRLLLVIVRYRWLVYHRLLIQVISRYFIQYGNNISKSQRIRKRRILYYSPFPSHPGEHGNQSTIQNYGRFLKSSGFHVDFVVLKYNFFNEHDLQDMKSLWDSVHVLEYPKKPLVDNHDVTFDDWYEIGLGEQVGTLALQLQSDLVICSYCFHSKILEFIPEDVIKIIDTHDKMGNRHDILRSKGARVGFFSCTQDDEAAYLKRADVVFARNEAEARYFDSIVGKSCSIVVPHFEPPRFKTEVPEKLRKIGIVASANDINHLIATEFINTCRLNFGDSNWPFVLCIAGNIKQLIETEQWFIDWDSRYEVIQLKGFVKQISEFYHEVDLIVSPVTIGTGINVKTVEALAYGMPLVTTKIGSRGIATNEYQYNHESLGDIVASVMKICNNPSELKRLTLVAKDTYTDFYSTASEALLRGVRDSKTHQTSTKILEINMENSINATTDKVMTPESKYNKILETTNQTISIVDRYVAWEGGTVRQHQGHTFSSNTLRMVEKYFSGDIKRSAETGCGKSTILLSNYSNHHIVFALDDRPPALESVLTKEAQSPSVESSVEFYRSCPLTRLEIIEEVFGPSQITLPRFNHIDNYDLVLLDGPHGYPFPDLEYYFLYPFINVGGLLIIDDVNIPTIGRMADILVEDKMWQRIALIDATLVLKRTSAPTTNPFGDEWYDQMYNRHRVSSSRSIFVPRLGKKNEISSLDLDKKILG